MQGVIRLRRPWRIIAAGAVAVALATPTYPQVSADRVWLWEGLHLGMAPQEVATYLKNRGIKHRLYVEQGHAVASIEQSVRLYGRTGDLELGYSTRGLGRVTFETKTSDEPFYDKLLKGIGAAHGLPTRQDFGELLVNAYSGSKSYGVQAFFVRPPLLTTLYYGVTCPLQRYGRPRYSATVVIELRRTPPSPAYRATRTGEASCSDPAKTPARLTP